MAADVIAQRIEVVGPQTLYPISGANRQSFHQDLGDGVELVIEKAFPDLFFTWGTLRDVILGLNMYLIDGRRFWQCYFNFADDFSIVGTGQIVRN